MKTILSLILALCFNIFVLNAQGNDCKVYADSTSFYLDRPQYKTALEWAQKNAICTAENNGITDTCYFKACSLLFNCHYYLGEYDQALDYSRKYYFLIKEHDSSKKNLAEALGNLGFMYQTLNYMDSAEYCLTEAVIINHRVYKNDDNELAISLNNLAGLYECKGDYSKAENLYLEALEMRKRIYKDDNKHIAISLNNMAYCYKAMGKYHKAEEYYKQAMEMNERLYNNQDNSKLAGSYNNLASIYEVNGKLSDAEQLYMKALEMRNRIYPGSHPDIANSLNNLAVLYQKMGNYPKAEQFYNESLKIRQEFYGEGHPIVLTLLTNLAQFYESTGNFEKADSIINIALMSYKKIYNYDHPDLVHVMFVRAGIYMEMREFTNAENLLKISLEMSKRIYGKSHPNIASIFNNLGTLYYAMHDTINSEKSYVQALEMTKQYYSDNNPELLTPLYNLASHYSKINEPDKAVPLIENMIQILINNIETNMGTLTEQEKDRFNRQYNLHCNFIYSFLSDYPVHYPLLTKKIYEMTLAYKGFLLNSSLTMKRRAFNSNDTNLIKIYEEWIKIKKEISAGFSLNKEQLAIQNIDIQELLNEKSKLEKQLYMKTQQNQDKYQPGLPVFGNIQNSLKKNEAAIDIIRFYHFEGSERTDSVFYAAFITLNSIHNQKMNGTTPKIVILKNGPELENMYFKYYRKCLRSQKNKFTNLIDEDSYKQYWEPIAKILDENNIKTVYFSADGIYHKINLLTLYNPYTKKYLIDEIDIIYTENIKDITIDSKPERIKKNVVFFGNPEFQAKEKGSINDFCIPNLPGTEKEIKSISRLLSDNKYTCAVYTDTAASEYNLKSQKNPSILHIATHGKFSYNLSLQRTMNEDKSFLMLKSFLLLYEIGKNKNLPTTFNNSNDGFFTAYETLNLFLDSTELVVLSACESGLGEIFLGEGVFSLPRAFTMAGAKSIIFSIWTVNDNATRELMVKFYKNWLNGMSKREAFREAQLNIKKKYKHPYYWGAFIMIGR